LRRGSCRRTIPEICADVQPRESLFDHPAPTRARIEGFGFRCVRLHEERQLLRLSDACAGGRRSNHDPPTLLQVKGELGLGRINPNSLAEAKADAHAVGAQDTETVALRLAFTVASPDADSAA
jgi:hypothetical protein